MNELLDELESHAWKGGDIVDTGRHNDLVMALAHAVDQFSGRIDGPVLAFGKSGKGEWAGGKSKARRRGGYKAVNRKRY
jgi:hypothetical protein